MSHRTFRVVVTVALVGLLTATLAGPAAVAADKDKRKDRKQGEAARESIDKQKEIAKGLKERASGSAEALQKELDALKAELQAENDRYAAALEPLNKDLKAQTDGGDRKRASRTQKSIEKEKDQHAERVKKLERKIADVQEKLDAAQAK